MLMKLIKQRGQRNHSECAGTRLTVACSIWIRHPAGHMTGRHMLGG